MVDTVPLPQPSSPWVDPNTGQPRIELWSFLNALNQPFPGPFTSNANALENGVNLGDAFLASNGQVRWAIDDSATPF
jgi:hypothetical protein